MATVLKKKKNRLGTPPPQTETANNLVEPEVAPATAQPAKKVDGRTLRRTGRTEQFNTTVSKEYLKTLKATAKEEGRTMGKILELSLTAYLEKEDRS